MSRYLMLKRGVLSELVEKHRDLILQMMTGSYEAQDVVEDAFLEHAVYDFGSDWKTAWKKRELKKNEHLQLIVVSNHISRAVDLPPRRRYGRPRTGWRQINP